MRASSTRHSMQTAPWPTAGSISSSGTGVPTCARPSRFRPASASSVASTTPRLALGQPRVDIAAQVDDLQVGPAMQELRAPAQRRRCRRPRPACRSAMRLTSPAISTSRASSRGRKAAITRPGGCAVGMSFMLCTAASMRPRQQRLLDLLDEQALAAGLRQRPVLDGVAGGPDRPRSRWRRAPASAGTAAASASRTRPAWVRASLLPRVPSRRRGAPWRCSSVGGPPTLEDTHARPGHRNELRRDGRRHRRGAGRRRPAGRPHPGQRGLQPADRASPLRRRGAGDRRARPSRAHRRAGEPRRWPRPGSARPISTASPPPAGRA